MVFKSFDILFQLVFCYHDLELNSDQFTLDLCCFFRGCHLPPRCLWNISEAIIGMLMKQSGFHGMLGFLHVAQLFTQGVFG